MSVGEGLLLILLGASDCSPVVAEKVKRRLMRGDMSLYSKWVGKTDVRTLKALKLAYLMRCQDRRPGYRIVSETMNKMKVRKQSEKTKAKTLYQMESWQT